MFMDLDGKNFTSSKRKPFRIPYFRGNYSFHKLKVAVETIKGGKLFKVGNYSLKSVYFSSFSVNQTLSCKTRIRTKCHFKEETRILDLGPLIEGVHPQTLEVGAELVAAAAVG